MPVGLCRPLPLFGGVKHNYGCGIMMRRRVNMMFEQRRSERYQLFGNKVEYSLAPFSKDETFKADVVNFSETGLCLLSSNRLSVRQEITVKDFMTFSSRTAVVIWVKKCDDLFYLNKSANLLFKAGLLFE